MLGLFKRFRYEIAMHTHVADHPNFLSLVGICLQPLALVTELAPHGTLYDLVHWWEEGLPWELRIKVAIYVAAGVKFMHDKTPPLAHLDLKSPNILLISLNPKDLVCAKISDFGTCTFMSSPISKRFVDNPVWLAPEIIEQKLYTDSVDTYAFGVITWELLTRESFFSDCWFSDMEEWITLGKRPEIPKRCPLGLRKVIESCWHQQPSSRPNFSWIMQKLEELKTRVPKLDKTFGSRQQTRLLNRKRNQPVN